MLNVTVSNSCQVLSVTAISYIKGGGVSDKSALNARSKSLSELVITHYSSGQSVTVPLKMVLNKYVNLFLFIAIWTVV